MWARKIWPDPKDGLTSAAPRGPAERKKVA
jgi:hypothetical protein